MNCCGVILCALDRISVPKATIVKTAIAESYWGIFFNFKYIHPSISSPSLVLENLLDRNRLQYMPPITTCLMQVKSTIISQNIKNCPWSYSIYTQKICSGTPASIFPIWCIAPILDFQHFWKILGFPSGGFHSRHRTCNKAAQEFHRSFPDLRLLESQTRQRKHP